MKGRREEWLRWFLNLAVPLAVSVLVAWWSQAQALYGVQVELKALKDAVESYNRVQDERIREVRDDSRQERRELMERISQLERRR